MAGDVDYELSADELQRRELARLSDAVLCERSLVGWLSNYPLT
jgi:hypothetical protein